jgi:hypothetical protein
MALSCGFPLHFELRIAERCLVRVRWLDGRTYSSRRRKLLDEDPNGGGTTEGRHDVALLYISERLRIFVRAPPSTGWCVAASAGRGDSNVYRLAARSR